MVMEESVHSEYRLSSLDHRYDERRTAAPWYRATAIVRTLDRAPQQEWPRCTLLDVPSTGRAPRRAATREITPLSVIRRIVAAIQLWRWRARSLRQLHELNDHLLKDIGLKREVLGYDFPKPFWYWD